MGTSTKQGQAGRVYEQSTKPRQAGQVNVPALTANIFAAVTDRTSIHNITGGVYHYLV
jgi:hypothetical protein